MTAIANLFDVRGGSLQAQVCEICTDPLEPEAFLSTCASCNGESDHEEDTWNA